MRKVIGVLLLFLIGTGLLYGESIEQYDVDIVVEESGKLKITENITYQFGLNEKHGIYRDIPTAVKVSRLPTDLGLSDFTVTMDGGAVEWSSYTISDSDAGELIRLQIGSPTLTIHGRHQYTITYSVAKGVLPSSLDTQSDAVRWNAIGTGWNVSIQNITVRLHLPPTIGQYNSTTRSFTGGYGSTTSGNPPSWMETNQIEWKHESLSPHEGYTVEVNYPKGLLLQSGETNTQLTFWQKILLYWHWPVLGFYLLYLLGYHKNNTTFTPNLSIAPQYNPPKGMSILQAGLIYDKFADNTDYSVAVVELAHGGYLKIIQKNEESSPKLIRTDKKSDTLSEDLKYLLEMVLFDKSNEYTIKTATSTSAQKLLNGFEVINEKLYDWLVSEGYMLHNPQATRKRFLIWNILLIIPLLIASVVTMVMSASIEMAILPLFASIFIGVGLLVVWSGKGIFEKLFGSIFVFAGGAPLVAVVSMSSHDEMMGFLTGPYMLVILMIVAMIYTYKNIGEYTQKGTSQKIYLQGLEMFMERVKADELSRWLKTDPSYLERLIPYAILFKMVDHWLELYEDLGVAKPEWFEGSSLGLLSSFDSSFKSSAVPPPSTSSSGGSSGGGGFSGGGGGGGGGGSW